MVATMGTILPTFSSPSNRNLENINPKKSHMVDRDAESNSECKANGVGGDLPKPLHITKHEHRERREEDDDETPRAQARLPGSRRTVSPLSSRSSTESVLTSASMDELPGGQRRLIVPKRRDNNASRSSPAREDTVRDGGPEGYTGDRQDNGVADLMASLDRMSLGDRLPDYKPRYDPGTRFNPPSALPKSAQTRGSYIPRSQARLSNKSGLIFLDRSYNGTGSEPAPSQYSDANNTVRTKFNTFSRNSSPSPSLRSTPGFYTTYSEAFGSEPSIRNSPRLRSSRSMHHISADRPSLRGFDGHISPQAPLSTIASGLHTSNLGSSNINRNYSGDSRRSSCDEPYILVPRIVVTPESKTLEDGATTLWAAVQISTQIRQANAWSCQTEETQDIHGRSQLDVFRYGCLYDVSIEVLPTESSVIVELLGDKACASTAPGLLHARQSSDDLIKDLEHHLGNTVTEYLQVRLKYHHSFFPHQKHDPSMSPNGVVDVETLVETAARAAIKQHNPSSLWSPRPTVQSNPLFEIIASHWGPGRASDVMQRIISSHTVMDNPVQRQSTPLQKRNPHLAPLAFSHREYRVSNNIPTVREASEDTIKPVVAPTPARLPPPIPKRQASLHHPAPKASSAEQLQTQGHHHIDVPPSKKTVWTQLRRTSLTERGKSKTAVEKRSYVRSSVNRVPSITMPVSCSFATIRPPSAPSFSFELPVSTGGLEAQGNVTLASAHPHSRSQTFDQGTKRQRHAMEIPKSQGKEHFTSIAAGHGVESAKVDWSGIGTSVAKRAGNDIVEEERAKRRQKMFFEQAATISVARGNKRGSVGTLPRGVAMDHYGSRRHHQPQAEDLYRAAGEQHLRGQQGAEYRRNGATSHGLKGKGIKQGPGATGTASGRWGWTGWWP